MDHSKVKGHLYKIGYFLKDYAKIELKFEEQGVKIRLSQDLDIGKLVKDFVEYVRESRKSN